MSTSFIDVAARIITASERRLISFVTWLNLDFYEVGLVAIFVFFCYIIYRLDHSHVATEFHFEDFFTHGDKVGKADIFKLLALGAFMMHSLVVWRQEVFGHLAGSTLEWYAGIWSGAYVMLKGIQTWKSTQSPTIPAPTFPEPSPEKPEVEK